MVYVTVGLGELLNAMVELFFVGTVTCIPKNSIINMKFYLSWRMELTILSKVHTKDVTCHKIKEWCMMHHTLV